MILRNIKKDHDPSGRPSGAPRRPSGQCDAVEKDPLVRSSLNMMLLQYVLKVLLV